MGRFGGVPSLRELMARAHGAGHDYYIEAGHAVWRLDDGRFLKVNIRRKDGTAELYKAVRAWERVSA